MKCPQCQHEMLQTKLGHVCLECGFSDIVSSHESPKIKPHAELVKKEHRLAVPHKPGEGKIAELTNLHGLGTEDPNAPKVFSWVRLGITKFSYYAAVFIGVVVIAGIFYRYLEVGHHERAKTACPTDIARSSADPVAAHSTASPEPCPTKKPSP